MSFTAATDALNITCRGVKSENEKSKKNEFNFGPDFQHFFKISLFYVRPLFIF